MYARLAPDKEDGSERRKGDSKESQHSLESAAGGPTMTLACIAQRLQKLRRSGMSGEFSPVCPHAAPNGATELAHVMTLVPSQSRHGPRYSAIEAGGRAGWIDKVKSAGRNFRCGAELDPGPQIAGAFDAIVPSGGAAKVDVPTILRFAQDFCQTRRSGVRNGNAVFESADIKGRPLRSARAKGVLHPGPAQGLGDHPAMIDCGRVRGKSIRAGTCAQGSSYL